MNSDDRNDMGMGDHKLHLAYILIFLIFASGILAANWPAFAPSLSTIIGGMLGASTIYAGGNVSHRWVNMKAAENGPEDESEEELSVNWPKPSEMHDTISDDQHIVAG